MLPEKKQILVVDDEANLRRVLAAQLSRDGYDVHTAEDGEAALAFLREHHIDLVITDLRMPKLDGMELLRAALQDSPERPVVMMTAHGTIDNGGRGLKLGAFDYVTKPFDQAEVRTIVKKALRTQDLASADASREAAPPAPLEGSARFGIIGESPAISRSTRSSTGSPTPPPRCSSPARAARAKSWSRARCTRARAGTTSPSSRSTAPRSPRI
jgi:two-component system response regulator AtoC